MKNMIEVHCPECKQRFQAPVAYRDKGVSCVHCKAQIVANVAPPIIKEKPAKLKTGKDSKSELTLFEKLNKFQFKELTRNQVLICAGVITVSIFSLILDFPSKNKNKTSNKNSTSNSKNSTSTRKPRASHYPVVRFIKENAKDPSSIEIMGYSEPVEVKNGIYSMQVRYRGKNGFGGYSLENKVFFLQYKNEYWHVTPE